MTEYIYDTSRVETQPEQGFTGEEIIRCRDCKHTEKGCWCRYFGQNCYVVMPYHNGEKQAKLRSKEFDQVISALGKKGGRND